MYFTLEHFDVSYCRLRSLFQPSSEQALPASISLGLDVGIWNSVLSLLIAILEGEESIQV